MQDDVGAWRQRMLMQQVELKASINDLSVVIAAVTLIYCVSLYSVALSILLSAGLLGFCVWTSWANQRDAEAHEREAGAWHLGGITARPHDPARAADLADTVVPLRSEPEPTQIDALKEAPAKRYSTPRRAPPLPPGDEGPLPPTRRISEITPPHPAPPPASSSSYSTPHLTPAPGGARGAPPVSEPPAPPRHVTAPVSPPPSAEADPRAVPAGEPDPWRSDTLAEPSPAPAPAAPAPGAEPGGPVDEEEAKTRIIERPRP